MNEKPKIKVRMGRQPAPEGVRRISEFFREISGVSEEFVQAAQETPIVKETRARLEREATEAQRRHLEVCGFQVEIEEH